MDEVSPQTQAVGSSISRPASSVGRDLAMKLTDLKDRIATILPDERNPMSLTWGELLTVLFVLVVFVFAVVFTAVVTLL
jgi:hypothetical protein